MLEKAGIVAVAALAMTIIILGPWHLSTALAAPILEPAGTEYGTQQKARKAVKQYLTDRQLDPAAVGRRVLIIPFRNTTPNKELDFWGNGFAFGISQKLGVGDLIPMDLSSVSKAMKRAGLDPNQA